MQDRKYIGIKEIARILDRSESWTRQNYKKLHKTQNFPLPAAGLGCCWDSKCIELWLDSRIPDYLRTNDNKLQCINWSARLRANAAKL